MDTRQDDDDDEFFDVFDLDWPDDPDVDYVDDVESSFLAQSPPEAPISTPHASSAAASFYDQYTSALRNAIPHNGPPISKRVHDVLVYMNEQHGLNLELFMGALFWGDPGCISDFKAIHERSVFMKSPTFTQVLSHWWCPPTQRQAGGGEPMQAFVMS